MSRSPSQDIMDVMRHACVTQYGDEEAGRTLRASGKVIDGAARAELVERSLAGEHIELELDTIAYVQTPGVRNRKFIRFKPGRLQAMAHSGIGTPFLRDHRQGELASAGGTISASKMVKTGVSRAIHQTANLTVPWAVQAALQGVMKKISIGWWPTGPVHCTLCKGPIGDCLWERGHWRGSEHDGEIVEFEVQDAELTETSAVNVPAASGTEVRDIRTSSLAPNADDCLIHRSGDSLFFALASTWVPDAGPSPTTWNRPQQGGDMEVQKLALALGCEADAGAEDVHNRAVALVAEVGTLRAQLASRDTEVVELQLAKTQAETGAVVASLRDEGRLLPGSAFETMALAHHNAGDVEGLTALANALRERTAGVPVGQRQSADENRPGNGTLALPPRTKQGRIDYEAMAAALPALQRERFAEMASRSSWQAVFGQPSSGVLWEAAGFERKG